MSRVGTSAVRRWRRTRGMEDVGLEHVTGVAGKFAARVTGHAPRGARSRAAPVPRPSAGLTLGSPAARSKTADWAALSGGALRDEPGGLERRD